MNLSLIVLIPVLTAVAILFCNGLKQVRSFALLGSCVQLLTVIVFIIELLAGTGSR